MKLQLFIIRLEKFLQVVQSSRLLDALLRYGVLVGAEHRYVLSRDMGTVVDIGANRGQFALAVRQWVPKARVISFEPLPGPASVFCDVFVLPSYTENFGMTVVEAMACGCPVVISDQVNIWREIKEENAGLVVGLNPARIADAICRVLGDKNAAAEMGRRGRVAAEKRYTWPRIVEQMTQVYRKLIEENDAKKRRDKR